MTKFYIELYTLVSVYILLHECKYMYRSDLHCYMRVLKKE